MNVLSEKHELIRKVTREFVLDKIKPIATQLDSRKEFPLELLKQSADLELLKLRISIPKKYGGEGTDLISECIVIEEFAREFGSMALIKMHNFLGCRLLLSGGTDKLIREYMLPSLKGEELLTTALLTEAGTWSDPGSIKTTAVLMDDVWVINGTSCWIANAEFAGSFIITAKTNIKRGNNCVKVFVIEKDTPGLTVNNLNDTLGTFSASIGKLYFDHCRIPKENLLNYFKKRRPCFHNIIDEGRILLSAMAVGLAQGALDRAFAYAKKRVQFDRQIIQFQAISSYIADMATQIEVTRTMLYNVAAQRNTGYSLCKEAAMLELFSSEMCSKICDKALQIQGGQGYTKGSDIERYIRDSRILLFGESVLDNCKKVIMTVF